VKNAIDRVAVQTTKFGMGFILAQSDTNWQTDRSAGLNSENVRGKVEKAFPGDRNGDSVYMAAKDEIIEDLSRLGPALKSNGEVTDVLRQLLTVYQFRVAACELAGELAKAGLGKAAAEAMFPDSPNGPGPARFTIEEAVRLKLLEITQSRGKRFDDVADRIRETAKNRRRDMKLSRAELAEQAGVTVNFVQDTETRTPGILFMRQPNRVVPKFLKLMGALGVDPIHLLEVKTSGKPS